MSNMSNVSNAPPMSSKPFKDVLKRAEQALPPLLKEAPVPSFHLPNKTPFLFLKRQAEDFIVVELPMDERFRQQFLSFFEELKKAQLHFNANDSYISLEAMKEIALKHVSFEDCVEDHVENCVEEDKEAVGDGREREKEKGTKRKDRKAKGYIWAVLLKRNWATTDAVKSLARRLGISRKRLSFAGTKDKRALTAQLISIRAEKGFVEIINELKLKDIELIPLVYMPRPIELGELAGNAFIVGGFSSCPSHVLTQSADKALENIPNYFGKQRFGNRLDTHIIGYFMAKGLFKEAVVWYLGKSISTEKESMQKIRAQFLELEGKDAFAYVLKAFPKWMCAERTLAAHLSQQPNDFVNAIRKLPRSLALMFPHALQSFIFNRALYMSLNQSLKETLSEEGKNSKGSEDNNNGNGGSSNVWGRDKGTLHCNTYIGGLSFPLEGKSETIRAWAKPFVKEGKAYTCKAVPGYEVEPTSIQKELMASMGLSSASFELKSMPELSSKGSYRLAFLPRDSLNLDVLNPLSNLSEDTTEGTCYVSFILPAGSYATVLLSSFARIEAD